MSFAHTTWSELITSLQGQLDNPQFWDSTECAAYINESLRLWQLLTGYWRDTKTITTHKGVWHYRLTTNPNPLLKPLRVTYGSTVLDQDSLMGMDWGRHNWEGDTQATPTHWFPMGINRIGVHPVPNAAISLTVTGLARAPQYSTSTDYVDIAPWLEDAILDYAQHIASFKQGGNEFAATIPLYRGFLEAAAKQNDKFRLSSIYRKAMGRDLQAAMRPVFGRADVKERK